MNSVRKIGLEDINSKKDDILNKLDEMENDEPIDELDKMIDEETGGKGYDMKEIKKMNQLIQTLSQ